MDVGLKPCRKPQPALNSNGRIEDPDEEREPGEGRRVACQDSGQVGVAGEGVASEDAGEDPG